MQHKRDELSASRLAMEQQLMEVIASIPAGPKSALQQFQSEKLEQLARSNVAIQSLEQQQVQNAFNNLPDTEHRALEQRATATFQEVVASAYDKLRQVLFLQATAESERSSLPLLCILFSREGYAIAPAMHVIMFTNSMSTCSTAQSTLRYAKR